MKLQDQVITIDQAKRLKELGVAQESHCHWVSAASMFPDGYHLTVQGVSPFKDTSRFKDSYSAFAVAELGVMLGENADFILYNSEAKKWDVGDSPEYVKSFLLESQARGAYLIHLIETEQLSVEVVNGRVQA